ncbi:hypothetical protein N7468_005559 [Penicillium chermesinum]|uniref:Uncharacterized protein n=1 Tax=Penicillium chermesinum TaxID=63820 RepID=A0A9W9P229_9EURO|nr:uncharacterized protein N7468_005559 [Penicillium chermesinum]KAJ5232603.1 hypothetical protein N7468_005559 [Penicillium chermesinum]
MVGWTGVWTPAGLWNWNDYGHEPAARALEVHWSIAAAVYQSEHPTLLDADPSLCNDLGGSGFTELK